MTKLDPQMIVQASNEVCRNNFFPFVWKVFGALHQGKNDKFEPAWHVRAMCHELDNVRTGENKRLIINIPPRCLPSVTVAVAYAAYLLGHNPCAKDYDKGHKNWFHWRSPWQTRPYSLYLN